MTGEDLYKQSKPNREAFEFVCQYLERGEQLTLPMLGMIFGFSFWQLMILVQTNVSVDENKNIVVNINVK